MYDPRRATCGTSVPMGACAHRRNRTCAVPGRVACDPAACAACSTGAPSSAGGRRDGALATHTRRVRVDFEPGGLSALALTALLLGDPESDGALDVAVVSIGHGRNAHARRSRTHWTAVPNRLTRS